MSSTNRGYKRHAADFYSTPTWLIESVFNAILPELSSQEKSGIWLEPCIGDGVIIKTANKIIPGIKWHGIDIRESSIEETKNLVSYSKCIDFLEYFPRKPYELIITNPPFLLAQEFIEHSLKISNRVIMLLRINYASGAKRRDFFHNFPPHVRVSPHRPSFTGNGKTDSTDYAWFDWTKGQKVGKISWLPLVPVQKRRK